MRANDKDAHRLLRFTAPFNFSGHPTLTLPCGFDSKGLPISFQLVGPHLSEDLLCRAGHAYQSLTDWHTKHAAEKIKKPDRVSPSAMTFWLPKSCAAADSSKPSTASFQEPAISYSIAPITPINLSLRSSSAGRSQRADFLEIQIYLTTASGTKLN